MKKFFTIFAAMLVAMTMSATTPSTDFDGGYTFEGADAEIAGDIEHWGENNYLHQLNSNVVASHGTATWAVTATNTSPCEISVVLKLDTAKSGHHYVVSIYNSTSQLIGSVEEEDSWTVGKDLNVSGSIVIPEGGSYTVVLSNTMDWSKSTLKAITLTGKSVPSTNFAGGYACVADNAVLSGADEKFLLETNNGTHYIRYADHSQPGPKADWKIYATRACFVTVTLNFANNTKYYSGNKHIMEVQLLNASGNKIDTIAEGPAFVGDGYSDYETGGDKALSGFLIIPKAGVYTIRLLNNRNHSKTGIYGVTLTYQSDIPTIKVKGDLGDAWTEHTATLSPDGQSASYTYEDLAQLGDNKEFGIMYNSDFRGNGYRFHRNFTSAENITGNSGNMKVNVDWAGDYTFTWYFKTNGLSITFPDVPDPVFYVAGTFTNWETSKVAMTETAGICTAEIGLEANRSDYKFKILKIDAWGTKTWYGAEYENSHMTYENCTNWQLTTTDGGKEIFLNSTLEQDYTFTFNAGDAKLSVNIPDPSATAIDDVIDSEKAVKTIENGQLVIIKNGVRYNVLGTAVK